MHDTLLTLATCWKITTRCGESLGFTDLDVDISIDGLNYSAKTGFNRSAIESSEGSSVDNLEIEAVIDSELISEDDILSGKYDFAEISIFVVDYTDPNSNKLNLRTGWIGEVSVSSGKFIAEIKGLIHALNATLGDIYSPSCRAMFGDKRCGVKIENYEYKGTISRILSEDTFKDIAIAKHDGYYCNGKIRFISGQNAGQTFEISSHSNKSVRLVTTPYFKMKKGDQYLMYIGCDKSFNTCVEKFNNAINFRGEPHINRK